MTPPSKPPGRVAVFASCIADLAAPGPARATVQILESMGCRVELPRTGTCCGQPALNSGFPDEARRLMRRWVETFEPYDSVVSPSGSCTATVHHHYPRVLEGSWADRARAVIGRTYEITQFVAAYGTDLQLRLDATVTYHDSCHMLRSLGEKAAPREMLSRIDGVRVVEMPNSEQCCGFGGTFSTKFPEVSVALADGKLADARATDAGYLVSADPGCLLHLAARAGASGAAVRTRHVAELIRDAMGVPE